METYTRGKKIIKINHTTGKHGNSLKGEFCHNSKFKNSDIIEIRKSSKNDFELSLVYNVNRKSINNIRNFKTWKHIK